MCNKRENTRIPCIDIYMAEENVDINLFVGIESYRRGELELRIKHI